MRKATVHRSGFTLVETVISLTLFSFGLLVLAAGLGGITRLAVEGRAKSEVTSLAMAQVARVRREGCGSSGERTAGPYTVRWSGAVAARGRLVTVVVERLSNRGPRLDSLTWFQRCAGD